MSRTIMNSPATHFYLMSALKTFFGLGNPWLISELLAERKSLDESTSRFVHIASHERYIAKVAHSYGTGLITFLGSVFAGHLVRGAQGLQGP